VCYIVIRRCSSSSSSISSNLLLFKSMVRNYRFCAGTKYNALVVFGIISTDSRPGSRNYTSGLDVALLVCAARGVVKRR